MKKGDAVELETWLLGVARRALKAIHQTKAFPEVILLSAKDLGRLKAKFGLKKPGQVPDVLAFPEPKGFPHPEQRTSLGKEFLGEIYLNKELPQERLAFLLIHGILHLLGFSHEKKGDTLKMERLEKKLLRGIFSRRQ